MNYKETLARQLFSVVSIEVTIGQALAILVTLIVTFVLAWMAKRITIRHFERHGVKDDLSAKTAAKLVALVVVFVGFDVVLHFFGVRLASLFAASGMLALAAGFAAKDIVANFLSGIILRLDRTISPGDVIQVDERWLRIQQIGARTTVGKTANDEEILIPNSTLAQSTVTNLTREDDLSVIRTTIGVGLACDIEEVDRILLEAVRSLDWISTKRESAVFLGEFTRYSINFEVAVWIDDPDAALHARSKLNLALWSALNKAGITLA